MKLITYPIAVSWMNERRTAIPMSSSNSARRQNETATAIATSASVAATSPTLTWIDGLVTGGLSAAISRREHRVHAHRQVHPLPGAGEQQPLSRDSRARLMRGGIVLVLLPTERISPPELMIGTTAASQPSRRAVSGASAGPSRTWRAP